jgi:hypothetical protein
LLPILRSRTQAGVLTVLLLNPDPELTQTELARRLGASLSSVIDEVRRLAQAGLLSSRTLGRARLVRAGSGPLVAALAEVMLPNSMQRWPSWRCSGPGRRAIAVNQDRSRRTLTSSSWSPAGAGPRALYAAADRAQQQLGRPVNPTVITIDR